MSEADNWIKDHSKIPFEKLHALGFVAYMWNCCELSLYWVFRDVMETSDEIAWAISFDLGNEGIARRIEALMKLKKFVPNVVTSISNSLSVFDICRRNRNQLTHFLIDQNKEFVRKSRKPETFDTDNFSNSVVDIRRIGDDLVVLEQRLWHLSVLLRNCGGLMEYPWPDPLPLPTLLWTPMRTRSA